MCIQKEYKRFHKIMISYVLILCSVLLLNSCNNTDLNWIDADGIKIWGENKEHASYKWDGDTFDCVANGKGILHIFLIDGQHLEIPCDAYYGALKEEYIIKDKKGDKFIGKIVDSKLEGFGVQIKTNDDKYIGNFIDGKPNGDLSLYKSDGSIHKGFWKNGQKDGNGIYIVNGKTTEGTWEKNVLISTFAKDTTIELSNGRYEGVIKDGHPHGNGIMKYKNGNIYNGHWEKGLRSGYGVLINQNDSLYGNWVENKLDGYGIYRNSSYRYEGDWTKGKPNGYGELVSIDKTTYKGFWNDGIRTDWGKIEFANNDSYEGDWENDLYNGYGVYHYSNGSFYKGEWDDGLQNGYGTYKCNNFQYEGFWEDGWMNGEGHFIYSNGDEYFGNIVENQRHGIGYYKFKNGNSFEGEFVDDKINGLGIFEFNDGGVFEGEFINGKIHGEGTLYIPLNGDTIAIVAQWNENKMPTYATVIFGNGDVYEGEIKNGRPTSNGKWDHIDNPSVISNSIHSANDYYKAHKDSWDKIVNYTSTALDVIETAASLGGGTLPIAGIARVSNIVLKTTDAAIKLASTSVDAMDEMENGDIVSALVTLGSELAINFAPKALKCKPARKIVVQLSNYAKKRISNNTLLKNSVYKPSKKLVKILKGATGTYEKKLVIPNIPISVHKILSVSRPVYLRYINKRIKNSALHNQLNAIIAKGPIELSEKELNFLFSDPQYIKQNLRSYIKAKTGNKNNFQEFFIRLSIGNKKQTEKLLNNHDIRVFVDSRIRSDGGYHEWLMTSKFKDYLLDSKWDKDGLFLALSITKFVQRTKKIKFKGGGGHPTSGYSNTSKSKEWHEKLNVVINNSSNSNELFVNIRDFAKKTLTDDKFKEFEKIFEEVFKQ